MAKQISFEKILAELNALTARIGEASDDCMNKRYGSKNSTEQAILKVREKHYDNINDKLFDIIYEIEALLEI